MALSEKGRFENDVAVHRYKEPNRINSSEMDSWPKLDKTHLCYKCDV